jgi:hypothetical protein
MLESNERVTTQYKENHNDTEENKNKADWLNENMDKKELDNIKQAFANAASIFDILTKNEVEKSLPNKDHSGITKKLNEINSDCKNSLSSDLSNQKRRISDSSSSYFKWYKNENKWIAYSSENDSTKSLKFNNNIRLVKKLLF